MFFAACWYFGMQRVDSPLFWRPLSWCGCSAINISCPRGKNSYCAVRPPKPVIFGYLYLPISCYDLLKSHQFPSMYGRAISVTVFTTLPNSHQLARSFSASGRTNPDKGASPLPCKDEEQENCRPSLPRRVDVALGSRRYPPHLTNRRL